MAHVEYRVDFQKILEVALKGVRRATVFLGLGVNAALDSKFDKYQLTDIAQVQLLPSSVDDKTLSHFKDEFKTWVVANGLRELIETFSEFLEKLHEACFVIANHNRQLTVHTLTEQQTAFEKNGLPTKFAVLKDKFTVAPTHTAYILTLNQARNCLTHRSGVVKRIDCNMNNSLKVNWLGMDLIVQTPSGDRHLLEKGRVETEGGDIMMQFVERERVFPVRSVVRFSPKDLAEICWFFIREAQSTCATAVEFSNVPSN
jgi:hypothetical protein